MSSFLLLQQYPACLMWMVLEMGDRYGRTAATLWDAASRICSI